MNTTQRLRRILKGLSSEFRQWFPAVTHLQIQQKLHQAWLFRWNRQVEDCLQVFVELRSHLCFPLERVIDDGNFHDSTEFSQENLIELLLLQSSLGRAQGRILEALELFRKTETFLIKEALSKNFFYYLEKGLFFHLHGDSTQALEGFMSAKYLAKTPLHQLVALVNSLLCLENLGLGYEETDREVKKKLEACNEKKILVPSDLLRQIDSFQLRVHFRKAEFSNLLSEASPPSSQGFYYQLWVKAFPFHRFYDAEEKDYFFFCEKNSTDFYLKSFRFRTLLGRLHPDDFENSKLSEVADRVYLWTWRWLLNSDVSYLEKILLILEKTSILQETHRLSHEDFQMVRNSLLWISLFDSKSESSMSSVLRNFLGKSQNDDPLYSFEYFLISYFQASRDREDVLQKDYESLLLNHPLYHSSELLMNELFNSFKSMPIEKDQKNFSSLKKSLRLMLSTGSGTQFSRKPVLINLQTFEIQHLKLKQKIVSEAMVKVLNLFRQNTSQPASELARVGFGITSYDESIHQIKLFNLIARIRKVIPGSQLKMKSGIVFGALDWTKIEWIEASAPSISLRGSEKWKKFLHRQGTGKRQGPVKARSPGPLNLSRKSLEKILNRSKSHTHRIIHEWVREGKIEVSGKAKNTRYIINSQTIDDFVQRKQL